MKILAILAIAAFAAIVQIQPTESVEIDLWTPVKEFEALYADIASHPLNLTATIQVVTKTLALITECLPPSSKELFASLGAGIQLELPALYEFYSTRQEEPATCNEKVVKFMGGPEFEAIHNFLWGEPSNPLGEPEWHDMIEFIYDGGFDNTVDDPQGPRNIYLKIRWVYNFCGATELGETLPTAPRAKPAGPQRDISHSQRSKRSADPFDLNELFQGGGCTDLIPRLLEILENLYVSNIEYLTNMVRWVLTERSDYNLHFFLAKLAEPGKGEALCKLREVDGTKALILHLDTAITKNPLIELLAALTGINFERLHLADMLISFAQYIIWRTPFAPPM